MQITFFSIYITLKELYRCQKPDRQKQHSQTKREMLQNTTQTTILLLNIPSPPLPDKWGVQFCQTPVDAMHRGVHFTHWTHIYIKIHRTSKLCRCLLLLFSMIHWEQSHCTGSISCIFLSHWNFYHNLSTVSFSKWLTEIANRLPQNTSNIFAVYYSPHDAQVAHSTLLCLNAQV